MAAEKNSFNETVNSLFKGMDSFISSKTVVGDAIYLNDTIILPLVDVSFGVGAGAFASEKSNNGGGGMGGKISPNSVLVIQGENIRLVNIKNQNATSKILDMIPDIMEKLGKKKKDETVVEVEIPENVFDSAVNQDTKEKSE
jgi:uncharacterized spore protein YtfJ